MDKELKELARRLESGRSDPEAEARLDEALDEGALSRIVSAVRTLPEDEPSMAWRSALNEEIRRRAPKARLGPLLRPAFGLALAGALAAIALLYAPGGTQPEGAPEASMSLEASLLSTHREMVRSADIAGVGITPHELAASHKAAPTPAPYDWSELDLETL